MERRFLSTDPTRLGEVIAVFSDDTGELRRVELYLPEHYAKLTAPSPTPIVFQQHRRARAEKMAPLEAEVFAIAEEQLAAKASTMMSARAVRATMDKRRKKSAKSKRTTKRKRS